MDLKTVRLSVAYGLFATKAEPDKIDRPADSDEHADQGENSLVQPLIQPVADTTPEKQTR